MKKILFAILSLFILNNAFAQQKSNDVAVFTSDVVDMGKIPVGTPKSVTFTVKNVGKAPLIIETVTPTCGCTTKEFTQGPIMPGQMGKIVATFNAASIQPFEKQLNVKFAGFKDMRMVTIKGEVVSVDEAKKL
jgi:archaellum component FlaG (FlaF/FlaG flagellin family)